MNNKTLFKLAVMCVLTAAASTSAFAADISGTTTIGNSTFAPSSNVTVSVISGATAYGAASQHLNGNRLFYTNNGDPKLYYTTKATGSTQAITPTSDGVIPANYSSL